MYNIFVKCLVQTFMRKGPALIRRPFWSEPRTARVTNAVDRFTIQLHKVFSSQISDGSRNRIRLSRIVFVGIN
ncbi:hypothetical protein AWB95_00025 [Mycobacterium celatum]|uniref:Uncharacterized protein n=1 Tax=Mycobacterium celatum TaxID=28045 RepID=A0A1X1RW01_MYCCE|nr:hypothetical protein AWB95_00025 [Mycobacterium celatum]